MGQKTDSHHGRDHSVRGADVIPPGAWRCATPITPATEPSGYQANSEDAAFQNGWVNIVSPDSALRWRFTTQGRVELVGAIDGGALGSVCVTLPAAFRPDKNVFASISSTDGSRAMTVSISASTGDVTVVGIATGSPAGASGVTAGSYGDATHVGTFTVDAAGRLTAAANVAITGGGGVATDTIFDAKGDIPAGTGADTAAKRTVGSNDQVLIADSSQSTGLKWGGIDGGSA